MLVSFIDEYGDNTELIWIWDPVERYVFREDLSTIAIGDSDQDAEQDMHLEADADLVTNLEDYVGLWEYQGENRWLRIHDDFTWEFVNDQDDVIESGTLWWKKTESPFTLMEAVTPCSLTLRSAAI